MATKKTINYDKIPLVNGHKYEEIETPNTWCFYLYNNRGRVLLQYSVPKHLLEQGRFTFWSTKVADLYDKIRQEKLARQLVAEATNDHRRKSRAVRVGALEANLNALFSVVEQEQQRLHTDLVTQANTDFLPKIKRVVLPI